ncbi:stage II sporulation protein P [Paenibacillus sinopodophylli]|uniref:stage II sporulation protein P n=1 Tax=Paenibacillus sinopodophylli TaxID=1837342 RepID=UPI00110CD8A4|nr:stage II sporulation protein P [Paenibacillus sinopodophylli]
MRLRNQLLGGTAIVALLFSGLGAVHATGQSLSGERLTSTGLQRYAQTKAVQNKATVAKIIDITNLRKGPGINYEIVARAVAGESYPILGSEGEWYQIKLSSSSKAYVANWVVDTDATDSGKDSSNNGQKPDKEEQSGGKGEKEMIVKMVATTNLRKGPGLDYEIVTKAREGESFPVIGLVGEWYQVSLPSGGSAYVANWVVNTGEVSQNDSKVYIYHTHNRESWKNVSSSTKGTSYDDPKVNITLVGKQLAQSLEKKGIASLVEATDFAAKLNEQKLSYTKAYAESRKAVDKAIQSHASLTYFFDIHRDADVPRNKTTVVINGKSYARIMFVIGDANPTYKENKKFADALSVLLDKKYPGISRGVLTKSAHQGNAEYNQSVSNGSLLLEFGGVNNTLQENLQTAEAFADVFAEYYKLTQ